MWKGHDHYISAKAAGYQALLMTHLENKENQSPNVSPSKTKPDAIIDTTEIYYCWSHGLGFNLGHTSCTCHNKKNGHKDDATIRNCQGGKNSIWECDSCHK
jgi:hypothetical protein